VANECYVVRIDRRDQRDPKRVAGVVEYTDSEQARSFRSMSELMRLLAPGNESSAGPRRAPRAQGLKRSRGPK